MKLKSLCALAALSVIGVHVQAAESEFSFTVHNSTKFAIKQILVSEDGKSWGEFDIGSGIAAGATESLVWDSSTNSEECSQSVKAVFSDGEESEPAKFDFCEEGLEIEF
ncbi:MAG: hypothetical protein Q7T48_15105 [Cellvibrio sp.]|uniref:hypothetical protein n=1 Tax=Cellvibrio sp. TaxID=1965322 RepID=UPI00272061CA|nr:hypothetical protein [Cellvibrio sp.]